MYGLQLNRLVNAQMDLSMAAQAALQAWTLTTVGCSAEIYLEQMNRCLEHAAASLGKKLVDVEPAGSTQ